PGEYDLFDFFKQKTAYEIAQCLVGSEMCIRDSSYPTYIPMLDSPCLLYTSDAADDSLRVDLGGRRIIKKNNPSRMATGIHPNRLSLLMAVLEKKENYLL
ncbi:hypothetical protein, partial [Staphylococcus aureus]